MLVIGHVLVVLRGWIGGEEGGDYLKEVVYLWWGSGSGVDFII